MDLQRTIYQDLIKWKEEASGKVLEVNGARQVGKLIYWINSPGEIIKLISISIWYSLLEKPL